MKLIQIITSLLAVASAVQGAPVMSRLRKRVVPGGLTSVTLDYGSFGGVVDGAVIKYLGIPFAAPPVGDLRFKPPQPPLIEPNPVIASSFKPGCMQLVSLPFTSSGPFSEDCLYLNVWIPADVTPNEKLPVVVFVYGGGNHDGSTDHPAYDMSSFVTASQDNDRVIAVTISYRVNIFGWLAGTHVDNQGLSNIALLDTMSAFKWVQKHISNFGGNPEKITAIGHSAGAINLAAIMGAKTDDPTMLFNNAILLSASDLTGPRLSPNTYNILYGQVLAKTGCTNVDPAAAFTCLSNLPANALLIAGMAASQETGLQFGPTISSKSILPNKPSVTYSNGTYYNIPIILGNVQNEGAVHVENVQTVEQYKKLLDFFVVPEFKQLVEVTYNPILQTTTPNNAASQVYGDFGFICPVRATAAAHASRPYNAAADPNAGQEGNTPPVYKYQFNQVTKFNPMAQNLKVAIHGSDVPYWLHNTAFLLSDDEIALSKQIARYVTSFATRGTPNHGAKTAVTWPRFSPKPIGQRMTFDNRSLKVEDESDKVDLCPALWFIQDNLSV
ncbi:hypothetical protein HDV05_007977 [Chytridiales sp. JEL 0842]|nr:hypothetical protein HDV05_007977 [Chytridiales sp. JEL 0842]